MSACRKILFHFLEVNIFKCLVSKVKLYNIWRIISAKH